MDYHPCLAKRCAYEIYADRRDVAFSVRIIRKPEEKARLSNAGVSNEKELEEVVVSGKRSLGGNSG